MLNKWSSALFVVFIIFLLIVSGAHAQRQHDSSEEIEEEFKLSSTQGFLTLPFTDENIRAGWIFDPYHSSPHYGIDFFKTDTIGSYDWKHFQVSAAADGEAFWNCSNPNATSGHWGCYVFIKHDVKCPDGLNYYTLYSHLESVSQDIPLEGTGTIRVNQGDLIGIAGDTGATGSPIHLHFEVHRGDARSSQLLSNRLDPYDLSVSKSDYYWQKANTIHCGSNHLWSSSPPTTPTVSPLSFTDLTPSTVNADSAPYDAFLTATGSNFNNVNQIEFEWTGDSGGGEATWSRGTSRWNEAVNVLSDTSMTLEPTVVFADTWSGTDTWTVTLRDTSNASASRNFTVNFNTTSCSVSTPERPDGPTSGETGVSYEFETGGSSCSAGHGVQYQFSMRKDGGTWLDGEWRNTGWMVGEFFEEGTYDIRARARCASNTSIISSWSLSLTLAIGDEPECSVSTPSQPTGPTSGEPGVNYTYSTGGSNCAAGHSVEYRFWWKKVGGSYTITNWSTSSNTTLSFAEEGTYKIDAEARCAQDHSVTSGYSNILTVVIEGDSEYYPLIMLYGSFNDAVYAYDGKDWLDNPVAHAPALALAVHDEKLYGAYEDGIYVYDGASWDVNKITPGVASNMVSYDDQLYGSFADATYVYDGTSWTLFTWPTSALASYQGYLYASFSDAVYAYDGNQWVATPVAHAPALALAAHGGKLYGAFEDGIYVYDGTSWDINKITPGVASNMASYDGKLYGCFADATYVYDGTSWTLFTWPTNALAAY